MKPYERTHHGEQFHIARSTGAHREQNKQRRESAQRSQQTLQESVAVNSLGDEAQGQSRKSKPVGDAPPPQIRNRSGQYDQAECDADWHGWHHDWLIWRAAWLCRRGRGVSSPGTLTPEPASSRLATARA